MYYYISLGAGSPFLATLVGMHVSWVVILGREAGAINRAGRARGLGSMGVGNVGVGNMYNNLINTLPGAEASRWEPN